MQTKSPPASTRRSNQTPSSHQSICSARVQNRAGGNDTPSGGGINEDLAGSQLARADAVPHDVVGVVCNLAERVERARLGTLLLHVRAVSHKQH